MTEPTEEKEKIKSAIDIVDFIDSTHSLTDQNDGTWWKGHTEAGSGSKTSLAVNKPEQYYKNHATGDGGDIFKWIAYRENLDNDKDFRKILKIAADCAGIELTNNCNEEEKDQVHRTMRAAMEFYHSRLTVDIREFIFNTWGITNETIDKLLIGYSPMDGAAMQMALKDTITQKELVNAGLIYDNKYDINIARIIFPYWENGKIVYTIGRATDSTPANKNGDIRKYLKQLVHSEKRQEVSKYINNDVIYGIDSVKGVDEVVITEGVTDAIALLQAGIPTISPITTSFKGATFSHVVELVKDKTIFVCNDNEKPKNDEKKGAGEKGALRTIEALNAAGLEARFIQLPRPDDVDKMDVAEYMKDHVGEDFRVLMDMAVVHNAAKVTRSYRMNDTGNALRMNDLHGENLLYCYGSKTWFHWDLYRWKEDNLGAIHEIAYNTVESIHDQADSLQDSDFKNKMQKFASSCGSAARQKAMIDRLESKPGIPFSMEDMDLDPWLFVAKNGTIDLRNGEFRESRREDMNTKTANVVYDPNAKCEEFMAFLDQMLPDPDTQRYIQECLGYAITGSTREEQIFINIGVGRNGKNTLVDAVAFLLGDYTTTISADSILTSGSFGPTNNYEMASLKGARLVVCGEPEKGKALNDALVKAITNSKAKMTAREIYKAPVVYSPTHTIFLSANERPYVKDNSNGTWRRLRLIPYRVRLSDDERDADLPDRLEKEASGILNWLIEGCLSWQKAGKLEMSEEVRLETEEYREDMDVLLTFLDTAVISGDESDTVSNKWLLQSYNSWAERNDFKRVNQRTFSLDMKEHGYYKERYANGWYWKGLKINVKKIDEISEMYPLIDYKHLFEIYKQLHEKHTQESALNGEPLAMTLVYENEGSMNQEPQAVKIVYLNTETLNDLNKLNNDKERLSYMKKYIESENFCGFRCTTSRGDESRYIEGSFSSSALHKPENNNGNGSCNKVTTCNDKLKENQIYLTKDEKNIIIDEMKPQYEAKTKNILNEKNIYDFGIFVHNEHDKYQIVNVMEDVKIKYGWRS